MTPIYDAMVRDHGHNPAPDHLTDAELVAFVEHYTGRQITPWQQVVMAGNDTKEKA